MTPEGAVKQKIKALFKAYGVYYVAPIMRGMNVNGTPDFVACVRGSFLGVEAKAGDNKPTKLQCHNHTQIVGAGGVVLVVNQTNLATLEAYLREKTTT